MNTESKTACSCNPCAGAACTCGCQTAPTACAANCQCGCQQGGACRCSKD